MAMEWRISLFPGCESACAGLFAGVPCPLSLRRCCGRCLPVGDAWEEDSTAGRSVAGRAIAGQGSVDAEDVVRLVDMLPVMYLVGIEAPE